MNDLIPHKKNSLDAGGGEDQNTEPIELPLTDIVKEAGNLTYDAVAYVGNTYISAADSISDLIIALCNNAPSREKLTKGISVFAGDIRDECTKALYDFAEGVLYSPVLATADRKGKLNGDSVSGCVARGAGSIAGNFGLAYLMGSLPLAIGTLLSTHLGSIAYENHRSRMIDEDKSLTDLLKEDGGYLADLSLNTAKLVTGGFLGVYSLPFLLYSVGKLAHKPEGLKTVMGGIGMCAGIVAGLGSTVFNADLIGQTQLASWYATLAAIPVATAYGGYRLLNHSAIKRLENRTALPEADDE